MGLAQQPNILDNCVHASASAFDAMAERLIWIKGKYRFILSNFNFLFKTYFNHINSLFIVFYFHFFLLLGTIIFTDLFGSKLTKARIPSNIIKDWSLNPIINGTDLFLYYY
jgi:hypothetical protein